MSSSTGNRMRKVLIVAGALILLVLVAAWLIPMFVDVNDYRDVLEQRAEAALGRPVELGELRLSLLPRIALRARDVSVAGQPEDAAGRPLVGVDEVEVGVRLLPLLGRRVEITQIRLLGPVATLTREADGRWSFAELLGEAPEGEGDTEGASSGGAVLSIDRLRLSDADLTLIDRALVEGETVETRLSEMGLTVDDLRVDTGSGELRGRIELDLGRLTSTALPAGEPWSAEARVELATEDDGTLRLNLTSAEATTDAGPFELTGSVRLGEVATEAEIDLLPSRIAPSPLARLARAAGTAWPDDLLADDPFEVSAKLTARLPADGTPGTVTLGGVRVDGLGLNLVADRDGRWNYEALLAEPEGEEATAEEGAALEFRLDGFDLTDASVVLSDGSLGETPATVELRPVTIALDRLPGSEPATLELTATAAGGGTLAVRGGVGPTAADSESLPLDLRIDVDGLALEGLAGHLRGLAELEPLAGSAHARLTLAGSYPESYALAGTARIDEGRVRSLSPDVPVGELPLELSSDLDLALSGAVDRAEMKRVSLKFPSGATATLTGQARLAEPARVDVRLARTELAHGELQQLLALAGTELPVRFEAGRPLAIEAHVHGPLDAPQTDARVEVREFTLYHPSLTAPLEQVRADVELVGEKLSVSGMSGRVASSDIGGHFELTDFDSPKVSFDLASDQADFGELFSFLAPADAEEAGSDAAAEETTLAELQANGRLRIGRGRFDQLEFEELSATMEVIGSSIRLEPMSMKLYGGTFSGAARIDQGVDPPDYSFDGKLDAVDAARLLTTSLGLPDLVTGQLWADAEFRGRGTSPEELLQAAQGGGSIRLEEGRLERLDVLSNLSTVTGMFGESSLARLGDRLDSGGTVFRKFAGRWQIDGGRLASDDVAIDTEDAGIRGRLGFDLATRTLDSDLRIEFSPEMSRSMRDEGSRAASAFWDPGRDRVVLPFKLTGSVDSPRVGIDWSTAATNLAKRKLEDEIEDKLGEEAAGLLGGILGGGRRRDEPSDPAPTPEPTAAPDDAAVPGDAPNETTSGDLDAGVVRHRSKGSFLLRDLGIEGFVSGTDIARAAVRVTDANGRELLFRDPLDEVASWLASNDASRPARIEWDVTVDGKKLVTAVGDLTVEITVTDGSGASTRRQIPIER